MTKLGKHTIAINVLNDELEAVVKDVTYLQTCLGKSKLRAALFPRESAILLNADLRWRRAMKNALAKGNALKASIKALEDLDKEE
jgi:hypothetical protein